MTNVILQPASGKEPREHYRDTVESLVALPQIRPHLSNSAYESLSTAVSADSTCVWGIRPSMVSQWNKIQVGDKVMFARKKKFFSLSTVTWKVRSESLALDLWGVDVSGDTWEFIYFFGSPEDLDIPYTDINAVVPGRQPGAVPQGVTVLSSTKAEAVLELLAEGNTRLLGSGGHFGSVPGSPVGTLFTNRIDLSAASVHRPTQAGISGRKTDGADSIVLNGGYVDDEDYGDTIVYTGHGGQDGRGNQVRDQVLTDSGNWALKISYEQQLPVRVTRGPNGDPQWSPSTGYRYDGLYRVVRYWPDTGIDGYRIWRYRLERFDQSGIIEPTEGGPVGRRPVTSDRLTRNSTIAQQLKEQYDFTCQICGTRLDSPSGPYAEAAHIKPLGRPDDGPDIKANMLCLCPNHHKLMDCGGVVIDDDYGITQVLDGKRIGNLTVSSRHRVNHEYISWHRDRWLLAKMEPNT